MKSYDELAAHITAVEKIGTWIAMSKMFGEMSVNQGCIIAADCFITGIPLLEYQRRNQLVGNRPNIPYDAMIAAFQEHGGKIKIIQRDADGVKIELTYGGNSREFSLMWSDLQKEPFIYSIKGKSENDILAMLNAGQKVPLKAKYATPRSRMIMMTARCFSDAIRVTAPEVNFGRYTPEEAEDIDDSISQGKLSPSVANVAPTTAPAVAAPSEIITTMEYPISTIDPPATYAGVKLPLEPADVPAATFLEAKATQQQREEAIALLGVASQRGLDWTERLKSKLKTHGILDGILGLTFDEAQSLIDKLKANNFDAWFVSAIFGHAAKTEGSHRPS